MTVLDRLMRRLGYVPASVVQNHVYITVASPSDARAMNELLQRQPIIVTTDYQRGCPCS